MCVLLVWRQIIYLFVAWILEVDLLRSLVPASFVSLECDSPCNNKSVMRSSSCNNKVVVLHTTDHRGNAVSHLVIVYWSPISFPFLSQGEIPARLEYL